MRNETMFKIHHGETTIKVTGTEDRVKLDWNNQPYIENRSAWIEPSKEVALIAHARIEDIKNVPEWLTLNHHGRYIRHIVTYVYESDSVRWAGQYQHNVRTIRLNVARLPADNVVNVVTHETAHCWFHNNREALDKFVKLVMKNPQAIDFYSRGRKLRRMAKMNNETYANEIHSILATLKHGSETGECSLQALEQDESRTDNEIKWFKIFAKEFDKVHTEKALNKRWVKATQ